MKSMLLAKIFSFFATPSLDCGFAFLRLAPSILSGRVLAKLQLAVALPIAWFPAPARSIAKQEMHKNH